MVSGYEYQDEEKKRDMADQVKVGDFEYAKNFLKKKCHLCQARFTHWNKPTLDRIDNKKNHSWNNVKPACVYCNRVKSDKD